MEKRGRGDCSSNIYVIIRAEFSAQAQSVVLGGRRLKEWSGGGLKNAE